MERTLIKDLKEKVGQEVLIKGWVDVRRDHGKLIFIDFRDSTSKVQMVALPNNKEAHELASTVRPEWVLEIKGKVNARPERMINKDELNGTVEIEMLGVVVLNEAITPPIDVRGDGREIGEDVRLKYRYLDLRRPRLQKNVRNRS
ncbi:MAG: OB-fold nucleic acid binding domain-containing protein, partial [bacterium]